MISDEARERMSQGAKKAWRQSGKKMRAKMKANWAARTPEQRAAISAAMSAGWQRRRERLMMAASMPEAAE